MARKLVGVKFSLEGFIREDKETNSFVSYCPALDLHSAGRSRIEAKNALRGAVNMYIRICFDRNVLGRILHESGFEAASEPFIDTPQLSDGPPTADTQFIAITVDGHEYDDMFPVEVPLHLIAGQQKAAVA